MRRVLLTGAAGFLGSHMLRHLLMETDWDIVCPVSFAHHGVPERIVEALGSEATIDLDGWFERVTIVKADLSCPINGTTAHLFGDIDTIINYASQSHVDRSIEDPAPFIRNNVDIAINLLEYARTVRPASINKGLLAFVQISTDEVYGPAPAGYAHKEWDTTLPSNPYSASKAAQEAIAIAYWRTYGVPVVITNCMNLIGETQDSEKFLPMLIKKISAGETVEIHAQPTHSGAMRQPKSPNAWTIGSRFYLHARNLADAVLYILRNTQPSTHVGGADRPDKWHIVGDREVDNLALAIAVAGRLGVGPRDLKYRMVDFHSSRPGHDLRYALDGHKLESIGWKRPVGFDDALDRIVQWTVEHPLWKHA